jgi:predicted nucleic acid-binding protein
MTKASEFEINYFDSSVILRYAINHVDAIRDLSRFSNGATTSVITHIECLRVLDRWRLTREISESVLVDARSLCLKILRGLKTVELDDQIVQLAAQSFPIAMKSLDAIHLATALILKKQFNQPVRILTHDVKLGLAARAMEIEIS